MNKLFKLLSVIVFSVFITSNVFAKTEVVYIPKNTGNPYFDSIIKGFEVGAEKYGYNFTTVAPATADATSQLPFIKAQIQRGVDVIAISPNSNDALNTVFDQAKKKGIIIMVVNGDIPGSEDHRDLAIMPVDFSTVGTAQMTLMGQLTDHKGQFAILSATTDAPDQNTWIKDMEDNIIGTGAFSGMEYLGVVYGDDDPQKSTTEAEALLAKYPDLRGIISPTTVGIAAAAQVVESAGKCDQVQVTGLGTPNQMRPFLKSGCVKAFQLWDPSVEGEIAGWLSVQMVENGLKLNSGMTIEVPDQGSVQINDNNLIYAAPMLDFVPGNIDNFNF